MTTFKTKLYDFCSNVASEFPGWAFSSGSFNNATLRHTTLAVNPGFAFTRDSTPLQPSISVNNKKSVSLYKKLNGYALSTSSIQFQTIAQLLDHMPVHLRLGCRIFNDKCHQMALAPPSDQARMRMVDISEVQPVLRSMLADGIALIKRLYDLSSEENLLRGLPPKYDTRSSATPYDELERQKGVMICIVRVLLGDFEFFENYRSDKFETLFPKRTEELGNIAEALPELKRLYANS